MHSLYLPLQLFQAKPLRDHPPGTLVALRSETRDHTAPTLGIRFDEKRESAITPLVLMLTHSPFGKPHTHVRILEVSDGTGSTTVAGCGPENDVRVLLDVDLQSLRPEDESSWGTPFIRLTDKGLRIVAMAGDGFSFKKTYCIDPQTWLRENDAQGQQFGAFSAWRLSILRPDSETPFTFTPHWNLSDGNS